jgi:hypothetical protein
VGIIRRKTMGRKHKNEGEIDGGRMKQLRVEEGGEK